MRHCPPKHVTAHRIRRPPFASAVSPSGFSSCPREGSVCPLIYRGSSGRDRKTRGAIIPSMKPNGAGGQVVIIGAGVAGLCCALRLQEKNIPCVILEASDAVGGRVRTDSVDGFLLDRGFQVLLTAYPEARRLLNYQSLKLRTFSPGALIRMDGKSHRISDPFRQPWTLPATHFSAVGNLKDK